MDDPGRAGVPASHGEARRGVDGQVKTSFTWIRSGDAFLGARIDAPVGAEAVGALIITPSFGRESVASFRTLRTLAVLAARRGFVAVSFWFSGTGDSTPAEVNTDLHLAWISDLASVVDFARSAVSGSCVNVLGFRLGAAIVDQLPLHHGDKKILWEPVSGRRFLMEQKILRSVISSEPPAPGGVEVPGGYLTLRNAKSVKQLELKKTSVGNYLVRVEENREVAHSLINCDPFAFLPYESIQQILDGLVSQTGAQTTDWPATDAVIVESAGGKLVQERRCVIGSHGLQGILTTPTAAWNGDAVALTAMGVEQAQGPGDLWVTLARRLAGDGYVVLRSDRRLMGEALDVDTPSQPIPYMDSSVEDAADQVRFLRRLVSGQITGVGVCAGAYCYLRAAAQSPLSQVIALNMVHWNPDTRVYRGFYDRSPGRGAVGGLKRSRVRLVGQSIGKRFPLLANHLSKFTNRSEFVTRILRSVPPEIKVVLIFGPDEDKRFAEALGWPAVKARAKKGGSTVVHVDDELDHSLISELSRQRVEGIVYDLIERRTNANEGKAERIVTVPDAARTDRRFVPHYGR